MFQSCPLAGKIVDQQAHLQLRILQSVLMAQSLQLSPWLSAYIQEYLQRDLSIDLSLFDEVYILDHQPNENSSDVFRNKKSMFDTAGGCKPSTADWTSKLGYVASRPI